MSAQDLEQQARELLAAEYERDGKVGSANHIRTQPLLPNKARAVRAIAAALRQQPEAGRYPSYDALLLIVKSVAGALERRIDELEAALARAQGVQP